ncbi:MAG TPA: hypothetical protein VGL27_05250 [Negativicutes bacterium]
MAELSAVEKKIKIQGNGIRISPELKIQLREEGYYPVALTWINEELTGPFSFAGYGESSPFELKKIDGQYQVFENGKFFTAVSFYRKPDFFDRQWAMGKDSENGGTIFIDEGMSGIITPCGSLDTEEGDSLNIASGKFPYVTLACYNGLVVWLSWGCFYNQQGNPCKFCCIPGEYNDSKVLVNQEGWLENLADTVDAAFNEIGSDLINCSVTLDAGTIPGRDKGVWAYAKVLEAIKEKHGSLPKTIYIRAVIEPPHDESGLRALRNAGFTSIQMDVDIYDESTRRAIMPNAKGFRPVVEYEKAFLKAKEIFPGEVATQLLVGIQSDENLLKGVERFASLGVPAIVTPFLPFGQGVTLRKTTGIDVPDAERMKRVYDQAANILMKYNVSPPQFRGGVSSLSEYMGKRLKRVPALTNRQMIF